LISAGIILSARKLLRENRQKQIPESAQASVSKLIDGHAQSSLSLNVLNEASNAYQYRSLSRLPHSTTAYKTDQHSDSHSRLDKNSGDAAPPPARGYTLSISNYSQSPNNAEGSATDLLQTDTPADQSAYVATEMLCSSHTAMQLAVNAMAYNQRTEMTEPTEMLRSGLTTMNLPSTLPYNDGAPTRSGAIFRQ
jgi:hypothetical protein